MASNPYAPPTAHVADRKSDTHGLKYRSLWLMVVFLVISVGAYYPIWFLRRRAGLHRLDSPHKVPIWPLLLNATYVGMQFVLALVAGSESVRFFVVIPEAAPCGECEVSSPTTKPISPIDVYLVSVLYL